MSDVLKELLTATADCIPLYDSSGQMIGKVDGKIMRYEFGSRLGFPEGRRSYSIAFVWRETIGEFHDSGRERVCLLARGELAKKTFDGLEFANDLVQRDISIQQGEDGAYHVMAGRV